MKSIAPAGYRFATESQWQSCLFAQAATGRSSIRPLSPLARLAMASGPLHASNGARAPSVAPTHEVTWRDAAGRWHRTLPGEALVEVMEAPSAIATSMRVVATAAADSSADYWTASEDAHKVEVFDAATLSRRFVVEFGSARVVDLAGLGHSGDVAVLLVRNGVLSVVRIGCDGQPDSGVVLQGLNDALGFAAMAAPLRYVVLAADARRILAFDGAGGQSIWRVALPTIASCFVADAIGSDNRSRLFVAGKAEEFSSTAAEDTEGRARMLVFDPDGICVDDVPLAESATGIAGARDGAWVTGARGLYRLVESDTVPDSLDEVRMHLLTPLLEAPDVPDGRRWLRVECRGALPPGTTLEIACGGTDDEGLRDEVLGIVNNDSQPPSQRLRDVRNLAALWRAPMVFHGSASTASSLLAAAPLYELSGRFLWVCLSLSAGAGAALPSIVQADVFYPGRTLMEQLPAVFQRDASRPGSFLRGLVGVLETTTQDLDSRIGSLGSHIHPATATGEWLDGVARWLGLPWDDALDLEQKRALINTAEVIARGRGTRAGLTAVLAAIVTNSPARWQLRDMTVDHGIAIVGGAACNGSRLPAMLGGARRSTVRLDVGATLGRMSLPSLDSTEILSEDSMGTRFLGRVVVSLSTDDTTAARWSPWLERLLQQMLPIGTTLVLRWLRAGALDPDADDGVITLLEVPYARLGESAAVGMARLRGDIASLPTTSGRSGPILH
jgi:phage tail-like protein